MSYVLRDKGAITTVFGLLQPGFAEERVADDDPELLAFFNRPVIPDKRAKAIDAVLTKTATEPDAPQEVKDWAKIEAQIPNEIMSDR